MKVLIVLLILLLFGGFIGGYFIFVNNRAAKMDDLPPTSTVDLEDVADEVVAPYVDPYPDDTDRDGITNSEEAALGLDTTEYDSDGDGLSDAFEMQSANTDPLKKDTDGDTLPDGEEFLIWKTDPTLLDTDGDGFDDGVEVTSGYDPLS